MVVQHFATNRWANTRQVVRLPTEMYVPVGASRAILNTRGLDGLFRWFDFFPPPFVHASKCIMPQVIVIQRFARSCTNAHRSPTVHLIVWNTHLRQHHEALTTILRRSNSESRERKCFDSPAFRFPRSAFECVYTRSHETRDRCKSHVQEIPQLQLAQFPRAADPQLGEEAARAATSLTLRARLQMRKLALR